ncbi:DUF3761 domain-containing protein [Streptomyces sp. bgisy084]|uniref:DUF3761 domain-containing protein n=1 Tax=Streptomyces sp. bgisy084 TaxID=3413777 RepID=UPI003D752F32
MTGNQRPMSPEEKKNARLGCAVIAVFVLLVGGCVNLMDGGEDSKSSAGSSVSDASGASDASDAAGSADDDEAPEPTDDPAGDDASGTSGTSGSSGSSSSSGGSTTGGQERAQAPAGASARCNDGTYSYSAHRRGTCSHHHGVAVWLRSLPV